MAYTFCRKCDKSKPKGKACPHCKNNGVTATKKKSTSVNSHRRFQKLRLDVIVRDCGECVRCRVLYNKWTPDTIEQPLHVHHIKGQAQYPHLAWEPNNLITLCKECHDVFDRGNVHELDFHWSPPTLYSSLI